MKRKETYLFSLLYLLAAALVLLFSNGTGDAGDSVQHHLLARSAFAHPHLLLDLWGKPIYTLLSAPFAQWGFVGSQCFNVLVSLASLLLTLEVARYFRYPRPWLAALFLLAAPYHIVLIFSGLTEPLFGLFLSAALYLGLCRDRWAWAVLLLSFMPFVRSEGMIMCGVFGLYLLWRRQWQLLPLFLVGHLFYSLIGGWVFGDFLWLFNKSPYAALHPYLESEAHWYDFAERLNYVIGIPLYGLLVLGLLSILVKAYGKDYRNRTAEIVLIVGGFLAFFVAHSLFWTLGIFNSMGLKRVLVGVMPLVALMALRGFHFVRFLARRLPKLQRLLSYGVLGYVLIFPFTSNPAALRLPEDFQLWPEQTLAHEVAEYIQKNELDQAQTRFFYTHPYLSMALSVDQYDPNRRLALDVLRQVEAHPGDLIIWDSWFAVADSHLSLEQLQALRPLQVIEDFQNSDHRYVLLRPIPQ
ncbi:MAG: hypothetical protein AAFV95_25460 [Bacteroidota bacterium]